MNESHPISKLQDEFPAYFHVDNLRGLTKKQCEAVRDCYVEERLKWDIDNLGISRLGMLFSVLLFPILIGFLTLYLLDKWKEKARDRAVKKAYALVLIYRS